MLIRKTDDCPRCAVATGSAPASCEESDSRHDPEGKRDGEEHSRANKSAACESHIVWWLWIYTLRQLRHDESRDRSNDGDHKHTSDDALTVVRRNRHSFFAERYR